MHFNPCFKTKSFREKSFIKHKQNNYHHITKISPSFSFLKLIIGFFIFPHLRFIPFYKYVPELEKACWKRCCGGVSKLIGVYICGIIFGGTWILAASNWPSVPTPCWIAAPILDMIALRLLNFCVIFYRFLKISVKISVLSLV